MREALELLLPMRLLLACECASGDGTRLLRVPPQRVDLAGAVATDFREGLLVHSTVELRRAVKALGLLRTALTDTRAAP